MKKINSFKILLLFIFVLSLSNSIICQSTIIDTISINCPLRTKYFAPSSYIKIYGNNPDVELELKNSSEYQDSLLSTTVCDSVIGNKYGSDYYLKVYDSNGILRHEGQYFGYKPSGKVVSYYKNGRPFEIKEYTIELVDGKINSIEVGTWIKYRISGKIEEKIEK